MTVTTLVIIPVSAAFAGWMLAAAAIRLLFRPITPVTFAGFRIQGVIPRQQPALARFIAETVETRLVSHDDVRAFIERPETMSSIESALDEHIDVFLQQKLGGNPMFGMLLRGEAGARLREMLNAQFRKAIPALLESLMHQLESGVDVKSIVQAKIESVDVEKVEVLVRANGANELRKLKLLGAVAGFSAGVFQLLVLLAAGG